MLRQQRGWTRRKQSWRRYGQPGSRPRRRSSDGRRAAGHHSASLALQCCARAGALSMWPAAACEHFATRIDPLSGLPFCYCFVAWWGEQTAVVPSQSFQRRASARLFGMFRAAVHQPRRRASPYAQKPLAAQCPPPAAPTGLHLCLSPSGSIRLAGRLHNEWGGGQNGNAGAGASAKLWSRWLVGGLVSGVVRGRSGKSEMQTGTAQMQACAGAMHRERGRCWRRQVRLPLSTCRWCRRSRCSMRSRSRSSR